MLLGACILMVALVDHARREPRARPHEPSRRQPLPMSAPLGPEGGFELVWKDRYLLWIAILIVLLNVVNTTGNYMLNKFVVEEAAGRFGTDPAGARRKEPVPDGVFRLDERDREPRRRFCCSCSSPRA